MLAARSEQIAAAAGVAALMGAHSASEVQAEGRRRFAAITLDALSRDELAEKTPNPELFFRARAARFGEVDAFFSHSWSDPAPAKWAALQAWRAGFVRVHGREPRVWIDKWRVLASHDLPTTEADETTTDHPIAPRRL